MDKKKSVGMGGFVSVLLIVAFLTVTQQAQAQEQGAFDAGYGEGSDDWNNGNPKHASCSRENSDAYCLAYETGYNAGWAYQSLLGRPYGGEQ